MADRQTLAYSAVHALFKGSVRIAHRPKIYGAENVPATGPVIIAANHRSFADSIYLSSLAPRRVRFMAKAEYFTGTGIKGALSRTFFESVGAFPVERGSLADAVKALDAGEEILRRGEVFGIYPEGTRSRSGEMGAGKPGTAELAIRTGAPIVPVGIIGTEKAMPIDANLPRPVSFTLRFGEPIPAPERAHPAGPQRRALTDELMGRIRALVELGA